jgi:hypothetical protein
MIDNDQAQQLLALYNKYYIIEDAINEINNRLQVSINTCQEVFGLDH